MKDEEIKEFTESLLKSNEKIKELEFSYRTPQLEAELIYDGDLTKEELEDLTNEFKEIIDVEFMKRIMDKYEQATLHEFNLYIFVDEKKDEDKNKADYIIFSRYNKTFIANNLPENVEGYENWLVYSKKEDKIIIGEVTDPPTIEDWGIELSATKIGPTGLTLICKQSGGELVGELQISNFYNVEEKAENQWLSLSQGQSLEILNLEDSQYFAVPMNDIIEYELDWSKQHGKLPNGKYRIKFLFLDFKSTGYYYTNDDYINFEIEN